MKTMSIFKNIHNKENHRLNFFLNIFTIIILVWIYPSHDDIFTYVRTIENKNKRESSLNLCFKRCLDEYVGETKIDKTGLYNNSPYYFENNGTSNYDDYVSTYRNMKNRDSKKLKLYKTGYKHRYAKKKGLSKLDCYYENKIFNKIDYIYNIADNWHGDKKSFIKMVLNKYGIYIFFILFPILGLIIPILFGKFLGNDPLLEVYALDHSGHTGETCEKMHMSQTAFDSCDYLNAVLSISMSIINIFVIIYIMMKIIKYEKLKACKGKMNFKEYCRFCKGIFSNKTN